MLVRVEGVSKKFCRGLKQSLWYGVKDTAADLVGRGGGGRGLRSNEFWAVDDVSFELRRRECLGLIGRNGAGKTTLLKMLNGLIKPDRGRIEMRGRVGALIALGAGFNPILTGRENIYVNGAVLGLSKREIDAKIDQIIDFAEIGEFIESPVQSYSSGMAVRLGFAVASALSPHILLLDEVLAVGDIRFQAKCFNMLAKLRAAGTAFIFVSHNMHMISRYCSDVLYLRNGQVTYHGDVARGFSLYSDEAANTLHPDVGLEQPQWDCALGSGKITFTHARFLNSQNQPVTAIEAGEPVSLILSYQRNDARTHEAVLDVVMRERDGTMLYQGTSGQFAKSIGSLPARGEIAVQFKEIPLNLDSVDFSVALLDPQTRELFDWKRNIRLTIRPRGGYQGRLLMSVQWSVSLLDKVSP